MFKKIGLHFQYLKENDSRFMNFNSLFDALQGSYGNLRIQLKIIELFLPIFIGSGTSADSKLKSSIKKFLAMIYFCLMLIASAFLVDYYFN
jgi:hypothetical protein